MIKDFTLNTMKMLDNEDIRRYVDWSDTRNFLKDKSRATSFHLVKTILKDLQDRYKDTANVIFENEYQFYCFGNDVEYDIHFGYREVRREASGSGYEESFLTDVVKVDFTIDASGRALTIICNEAFADYLDSNSFYTESKKWIDSVFVPFLSKDSDYENNSAATKKIINGIEYTTIELDVVKVDYEFNASIVRKF